MTRTVYPDLETAMVIFNARWSVDFVQPNLKNMVEIQGKDGIYHVLQRIDGGIVEVCSSLSSIINLFDNPSSVKSKSEAE